MSDAFARAFAFMRRADIAGTREEPHPLGVAVFDDEHRLRWDSNYLLVERDPGSADALAAELDLLQGGAGLAHRKAVVPDERVGDRLAPSFEAMGWEVGRTLVMVHGGQTPPVAGADEVREVSPAALRPARTRAILGYPWGTEEVARALLDSKDRIAARMRLRCYARLAGEEPVSWADLYSDGDEAQVEDVATEPAHRGRGLASSVVVRAVQVARSEGASFVFLAADDADWPKELYARLGFVGVGRYVHVTRAG